MNRIAFASAFTLATAFASGAFAQVRHEGTWPIETKHVSIDATHVGRKDAILRVAKEAGWSVVLRDVDDTQTMDLHLDDLPADKALDVILADGDFVAKRDGTLITISTAKDAAAATPPPPLPTAVPTAIVAAPAATTRGEDRIVHGGSLTIGADETVHDVTVFGGSLDIKGTVTGNMTVFGGSCHVRKGAHVVGNATALGGSINVDDGAQVDGDVGVVGGSLDRHKGSKINGRIHKGDDIDIGSASSGGRSLLREVSDATTRAAMLFVFGAVLFALAGQRMNTLRVEAASRPMRAFALGIVGGLVFLVSVALIAVTIIGIPVAIVLLLGGVFAAYAGICAVLATVGKALIGHKSDNPHVHLLVGCLLFLVSGAIPFVSGLVTLAVVLTGIGVVVATRAAGVGKNGPTSAGPYRSTLAGTATY
ncbi:MAG TPA: polymer-forming cytoskeletal protein [Polyangiaceae bacterium]